MHITDTPFCAVDLETTGLNTKKDEILSFASVPIRSSKIIVHESYYTLIHPNHYNLEAMKYHGISKSNLEGAPSFHDVASRILHSLDGIIVGHSVEYDYMFLKRYYKIIGVKLKKEYIDIAAVEQWLGQKCGKLCQDMTFEAILKRYGLWACHRHNALADAFFAAQIFQLQLTRIVRLGVETSEALIRAINRCEYAIW